MYGGTAKRLPQRGCGLLADPPQFAGDIRLALRRGNLRSDLDPLPRRATAEIARRHSDGTWLWVADQPNVTRLRSTTAAAYRCLAGR